MEVYYQKIGLVNAVDLVSGKVILPPEALASALASKGRFAGQTSENYSVLRHSLQVGNLAGEIVRDMLDIPDSSTEADKMAVLEATLWGILHDATEAVMSDVAAPIKRTAAFASYRKVEDELSEAYQRHYIPSLWEGWGDTDTLAQRRQVINSAVHTADVIRLNVEAVALLPKEAADNVMDTTRGSVREGLFVRHMAGILRRRVNDPLANLYRVESGTQFIHLVSKLQSEIERMVKKLC